MTKLEHEIINILIEAGASGLSLQKIVLHVYNACNSFFDELTYEEVYTSVSRYLLNCTADRFSFVQRLSRGVYVLNREALQQRQLFFDFSNESTIESSIISNSDCTDSLLPLLFDNID